MNLRNPLTVPVADATPEEIGIQARYHALNAAKSTLEKFVQHEYLKYSDLIAELEPITPHIKKHGDIIATESVRVFTLYDMEGDFSLVYYQGPTQRGYGLLDARGPLIEEHGVAELQHGYGDAVVGAMSKSLNEMMLLMDMHRSAQNLKK